MESRLRERWAEIDRLLDHVLDSPPDTRLALLAEIGSRDADLRAELERLLRGMESAEKFLQEPAPSYAAPLIRSFFERDQLSAGTRLGGYEIVSELGRGGTATVYLAHDQKHQRRVAVKVPHVELASAVRPKRFLREIQIAAQLQHPNILPLHDSGEADGSLYYVMPYVEGESLRQRLEREGQLPLEDALHIARQVADALDYAHRHGVVHRDIKPENILLSGGHALVADFGIARAITMAGGDRLTETGPLGTAAYMSPEQAAADPDVDGRSDIYSLGCVVYEMLSGARPFTDLSPETVLVRHLLDPVPPLRPRAPSVPENVEQAVTRALAKSPGDRFATATEFLEALDPRPVLLPAQQDSAKRTRRLISLAGASAAVAIGAVSILVTRPRADSVALNDRLVTILPFRASGADSTLARLSGGLNEFLSRAVAEVGGVRIVDLATLRALHPEGPAATLWTEAQSRKAAASLRAGRIVRGSVAMVAGRLSASAELLETRSGGVLARADANGSSDSLDQLARQLAGILLVRAVREPESRIPHLLAARPAALRWYVEGRKDYKSGRAAEALDHFITALRDDSAFADAALAAGKAADARGGIWVDRGPRLAWVFRDRLSEVDRAYLQARLGPRYPEESPALERLRMWEKLIDSFQDRPDPEFRYETLYQFAELMFHNGAQMGVENAMGRAATALTQAWQTDSTFTGSTEHLRDISFLQRDTATLRRMVEHRLTMPVAQEDRWISRWMLAVSVGDSTTLREITTQHTPPTLSLFIMSQQSGLGLDAAERVARQWLDSSTTEQGRLNSALQLAGLALNQGRPASARIILDQTAGSIPVYQRLYHAMYWGGDTASAAETAQRLEQEEAARTQSTGDDNWYQKQCALEMWRLFRGRLNTAPRTVRQLRASASGGSSDNAAREARNCAFLLEKWHAIAGGGPAAQRALEGVDQWLRSVPPGWRQIYCANLLVVRWREARGELREALNAARRRAIWLLPGTQCLSSFRREEGRLALAVGDTAGAVAAWRHFLALRSDPEPPLKPERDRIAALVAQLQN